VRWDARTLAAFARASRTIAAVEPFLTKGKRCDGEVGVSGSKGPAVAAYEHNGQILILVINQGPVAERVGLQVSRSVGTLVEFDTTKQHDPNKLVSVTVPAGDFVALSGPLAALHK
jgi:hypothetical protein